MRNVLALDSLAAGVLRTRRVCSGGAFVPIRRRSPTPPAAESDIVQVKRGKTARGHRAGIAAVR